MGQKEKSCTWCLPGSKEEADYEAWLAEQPTDVRFQLNLLQRGQVDMMEKYRINKNVVNL